MAASRVLCAFLAVLLLLGAANAQVVELNPDNYKSVVEDPTKDVFVMFYAPWCGHCNNMKPDWELLAADYPPTGDVVIAKVDATLHRSIGRANGVQGFPTLKIFTKTNKAGEEYEGPRTKDAWKNYIKSFR